MDHRPIADSEWERIHLPEIDDDPNRPDPPPLQKTVDPHVPEVQRLLFHETRNPALEDSKHNMDPRLSNVKQGVWKWNDGNYLDNRGKLRWKTDLEIVDSSSSEDIEVGEDTGNLEYSGGRVSPGPEISSAATVQVIGQGVNDRIDEHCGLVPWVQISPPPPSLTTGEPGPLAANPANAHPQVVTVPAQGHRAAAQGDGTDTEAFDPDFTWADYDELMAVHDALHRFVDRGGTFDGCGRGPYPK
ncbi:MAG: hypothetical protein Q9201_003163 [Fulgogasparrea decipioides]